MPISLLAGVEALQVSRKIPAINNVYGLSKTFRGLNGINRRKLYVGDLPSHYAHS
jgi:hypothetical protein